MFYPIGDSNFDGQFDVDDIDLLAEAIHGEFQAMYDLKEDAKLSQEDLNELVHNQMNTWLGDANVDGEFNSGDLVKVFEAGQYEDAITHNSTWETGDWNGDGEFDSGDFVAAFQDGGFETGPRIAVNTVPEPSALVLLSLSLLSVCKLRRSR